MIVAIPPREAAMGIPSNNAFEKPDFLPNEVSRGMTAAITMAVVAEFDISIEATIVVNIRPISKFLGFVPETFSVYLKSVSSNFVLVMAEARKKPPSNSQITLLEKVWAYFAMSSGAEFKYLFPSVNTRYAMIKRLTAKGGIASVSHKPIAKNRRKRT